MAGNQLSLFGEEKREERPPAAQGGAPASSTSPAPSARPAYRGHDERLAELGLKYGCAHVYRFGGRLYAWGDYTHCPKDDIDHNIRTLAQRLVQQPGLTHYGKAYDSDTYQSREKLDWTRITGEVRGLYREKLFQIDDQGNVTGEADGSTKD